MDQQNPTPTFSNPPSTTTNQPPLPFPILDRRPDESPHAQITRYKKRFLDIIRVYRRNEKAIAIDALTRTLCKPVHYPYFRIAVSSVLDGYPMIKPEQRCAIADIWDSLERSQARGLGTVGAWSRWLGEVIQVYRHVLGLFEGLPEGV